jgi:hypothetical protein
MSKLRLVACFLSLIFLAEITEAAFKPWDIVNYGRYGGFGHKGGEPKDVQDANYRLHDREYHGKGFLGWRGSRADARLIERSATTILNPCSDTRLKGRLHGAAAIAVFGAKPSIYETRVLGKNVPVFPSTGAESVVLHAHEVAFNKAVKPVVKTVWKKSLKKLF